MATSELKRVGRYTIERVLGRGAMGVVYEGFDPKLNRRVAVKTILKSHLEDDTARDYSLRFEREAQAVARLNHPNIVQVHDFGEEGDVAFLVMEFIKGKELKSHFDAKGRFALAEAVRIMRELCDALDFAHKAGVIHRDVKPGNVMLDAQMRVKLTDFGVARLQDTTRSHATAAGTMVGTPAYMSPEQIRGAAVDGRSDVFSAGIILYQLLTGEMPFSGGGPWTIAKKIMQDQPPLPSSLNTSVSPVFDAVVNKALAKDPQRRYQTARDLAVALDGALAGKLAHDPESTVAQAPASVSADQALSEAPSAGGDAEVEFWRSIKDGSDPKDFELYLEQFPEGLYAKLARHKISKLRRAESAPAAAAEHPIRPVEPPAQSRKAPIVAIVGSLVIVAAAAAAWFVMTPATRPSAPSAEAVKPPQPKIDDESIAQQKAVAEKAAAEKAAAEKAAEQDRLARQRAAEEKSAAEAKKAAEKSAAAKLAAEKAASDLQVELKAKASAELAALEKAKLEAARQAAAKAAEKEAADRAAAAAAAAQAAERQRIENAKRAEAAQAAARAQAAAYSPPPPPRPRYTTVGRIVEVYQNYGYVVFENTQGTDIPVSSTVYVRAGGELAEFKVSRKSGNLISATPRGGLRNVAAGSDVLQQTQ